MKRMSNHAAGMVYIGVTCLMLGFDPNLFPFMEQTAFLHTVSHFILFSGAVMFFYGVETLRKLAGRHRRMTT